MWKRAGSSRHKTPLAAAEKGGIVEEEEKPKKGNHSVFETHHNYVYVAWYNVGAPFCHTGTHDAA